MHCGTRCLLPMSHLPARCPCAHAAVKFAQACSCLLQWDFPIKGGNDACTQAKAKQTIAKTPITKLVVCKCPAPVQAGCRAGHKQTGTHRC